MNRTVITILLGSLCLLSGCIEVSYNSSARLAVGKKQSQNLPIPDDDCPVSDEEVAAILARHGILSSKDKSRPKISVKKTERKRGFSSFKRREK